MRYRIEYTGGRRSALADSRQELLRLIKMAAPGTIEDIRKLYQNGVSDSVMEKYEQYLKKPLPERQLRQGPVTRQPDK